MSTFELSLDGPWRFKAFAEGNGEDLGANKPDCCGDGWLPAQVPGAAHLDLLANGLIPDPFKGLNEGKVAWVPDSEWWYRREFTLPPEAKANRVIEVVFEGLDTFAAVWINGVKVGEADNMFTRWRFNVTKAVKQGANVVAVRFKPVYAVALGLEREYGGKYGSLRAENFSARPYVRKEQCSFGWDWGPILPTAGIWRPVKIVAYDKARLGYLSTLPLSVCADKATVKASADVYASEPCQVTAKFILEGFGAKIEEEVTQQVDAGLSVVECELEVSKPQLWWPRGYGEPNLYDASVALFSGSTLLDKAEAKCGVRSVKLLQQPDEEGKSFVFQVNGLPVFCKGASWIPADSFLPRVTAGRYRLLLTLAAEANFNMLRVWGGGVYEDDLFYDLCDAFGLMVWQDFMYACSAYPDDDWFLQAAEREAFEVVHRLRGHPSIVVWCGNNEIQWQYQTLWKDMPKLHGLTIWEKILPELLGKLDGTRPYRPSTPYDTEINGEREGSRHNWVVWSKGVDYPAYLRDNGRFLTEFGWQAPCSMRLLSEYLSGEELKVDSPALQAHEKQVDGLAILRKLLTLHYPSPKNLTQLVLYGQLNQADALKTALMHWRSRMFKTGGCLIWQLDDCWPVISWSIVDYALNPKAAYYAVKHAFQPVIATLLVKDGKVRCHVINETSEKLDLTFKFELLRFTGETLHSETVTLASPPYASIPAWESTLEKLSVTDDSILAVALKHGGETVFEDFKPCRDPKDLKLPEPDLKMKAEKVAASTFNVLLESSVYVKGVHLETDGSAHFSDDFFDLLPNKPKTVVCKLEEDMTIGNFQKNLTWQAYPYG